MALHYVRRGGSWDYNGQWADRGLILTLSGAVNDEKLVRLGYLDLVPDAKKLERYPRCGHCGAYFLEEGFLKAHGDMRHSAKPERIMTGAPVKQGWDGYGSGISPGAIVPDLTGDREEALLDREAPIFWEKTAASQKG
jgi:hypothetical protein